MSLGISSLCLSRRRLVRVVWAALTAMVVITLVTFTARAWWTSLSFTAKPGNNVARPTHTAASPLLQSPTSARSRLHSRLSLQPEADKLRLRLGQRFLAPGREVATLIGTLKLGTLQYTARITRKQEDDGESMTVGLNGGPASLTWNGKDGAKSGDVAAQGTQRALLERIALDSPDQFVLAQLRSVAYHTIARQARPAEAKGLDKYKGPVWDLVRIGEVPQPGRNLPQSQWRLYHINSATGLVEKVVSKEQGQTITAEIGGWVNQGGETVPTRITWKQGGQTVMEFTLTNITHGPRQ